MVTYYFIHLTRYYNDTIIVKGEVIISRFTLLDVRSLVGKAGPGLPVVLPAPFQLDHGGGAPVPVDDAAVPGQRLGQAFGFALDAHLHGCRVHGLVRIVAVAGDDAAVDHLGRYHVDDGVVDFGHGDTGRENRQRWSLRSGKKRCLCARSQSASIVEVSMACVSTTIFNRLE